MKHLISILSLFVSLSAFADTYDLARRFGITVASGWQEPILGNRFDDRADGEAMYGLYGRYQLNQESALQFGYTRHDWHNSPTAARIYDVTYLYRTARDQGLSPVLGLGAGLVDIANYNVDENLKLGLRARAGIEYSLSPDFIFGAHVDYQFVNKMIGEDDNLTIGEMHILAPQVNLTYLLPK